MTMYSVEVEGTYYDINDEYEYEDLEVTAILNALLNRHNGRVGNTPVYAMAAVDTISPGQLAQRLEQDRSNHGGEQRMLLIPCNIGNYHWVGLLLEFNENNTFVRTEFINSSNSSIPQTLQDQLFDVYQQYFSKYHNVIKQSDGTSCGACTIENLILRMQNINPPVNISMSQLRAQHLNILRIDRGDFFESFNQRQRLNQRTFDVTQFAVFKEDANKSESDVMAIMNIASLILEVGEGEFLANISAVFNDILMGKKEHRDILDELRGIFDNFPSGLEAQKLIFNFKGELKFDYYYYLIPIAELVVYPHKIKDIKDKKNIREQLSINLRDQDDLIRQKAAESLREMNESLKENELNLLREIVKYDVYQTVRIAAAETLYTKGIEADRQISREVVSTLLAYPGIGRQHQGGADLVRARAAHAIVILRDDRAEVIEALKYARDDPFKNVSEAAIKALQQLDNASPPPVQNLHLSAKPRLDFLKQEIALCAQTLQEEFKKADKDMALIRLNFYLFSWRINELSWSYKYSLKDKRLVSEEAWHLFDFICRYLAKNPRTNLEGWKDIAEECNVLAQLINEKSLEISHSFVLMLMDDAKPVDRKKTLRQVSDRHGGVPILIKENDKKFSILGCVKGKWDVTELEKETAALNQWEFEKKSTSIKTLSSLKDSAVLNTLKIGHNQNIYPSLVKEIRAAYAACQLEMIQHQIDNFFSKEFIENSTIDCQALLGLLMVIGEGSKRLQGINPPLTVSVENTLIIIKDIRDFLEKKLPENLFTSPKLMEKVSRELTSLREAIEGYFGQSPRPIILTSAALSQLLLLLEETSSYKCLEQAKLFFASLTEEQKALLKELQDKNYNSFLRNRFDVDYNEFKAALAEERKNATLILDAKAKDKLVQIVNNNLLNNNSSLKPLLKLIRSPKTKINGISRFLVEKNLKIPELECFLGSQVKKQSDVFAEFFANMRITKDQCLQVQKCFETLEKDRPDDFEEVLFKKVKELPFLLNLSEIQCQLLRALNQEEPVSDENALTALLKANRLDGEKIEKILYPSNLLYTPRPYAKKFAYPQKANNEILRVVRKIDELIKLLIAMKEKEQSGSFLELLIDNSHYQLALQHAIKAFGVIVKDKLGREAKEHLLASNKDELSAKHIRLLELFRDELAHRSTEVDVYQLTWFALQWATISYPAMKQLASTPLSKVVVTSKKPIEFCITESILTTHAALIQDLAKAHGFGDVRAFGSSVGCGLGIQAELNLLVSPLSSTTRIELYMLQWEINFILGWNVQIFTEKSLREYFNKIASHQDADQVIQQAIPLVSLQNMTRVKKIIDSKLWHSLILSDKPGPLRRVEIDIEDIDIKKIKTIIFSPQSEHYLAEKQYSEKVLGHDEIKEIIKRKAKSYTDNMLTIINGLDNETKPIITNRLRSMKCLDDKLDQVYEKNIVEIQTFDPEMSRLAFRLISRTMPALLPPKMRDLKLVKQAKKNWDKVGDFFKEQDNLKQRDEIANSLNMLYFFLDEIRNPGIVDLLFAYKEKEYEQLLGCVYSDFCKRFIDPYEDDASINFVAPLFLKPNQRQIISRIPLDYQVQSGIHMIWLGQSTMAPQRLQPDTYIRISFYSEICRELPSVSRLIPIFNWGIESQARRKILYIRHSYNLLPPDKVLTTDTLFTIKSNFEKWKCEGKVQKLNCQANHFEYPPITDFDALLIKEKINKRDYPNYAQQKVQFNEFQQVKAYLYNIYDYEMHILNIKQYRSKLRDAASTLIPNSQAYILNQSHSDEIFVKIKLLKDLQRKNINQMFASSYITSYSSFRGSDFKKRVSKELADWIYHDKENSLDKDRFNELISNCLNRTVTSPSFFLPSQDDLTKDRPPLAESPAVLAIEGENERGYSPPSGPSTSQQTQ